MERWLALLCVLSSGCVSDLTVGLDKTPFQVNDAAAPGDAGRPDAGPSCPQTACDPVLAVPVIECDGGVREFVCERGEDGVCALVEGPCVPPIPSGPCEPGACELPALAGPAREPACSDGSAPSCDRDPLSGICSYQCPASLACGTADAPGCADDQYCVFRVGMCGTGGGGVCATRPPVCDAVLSPVCGCDGQSYASECAAAAEGVNIVYAGACDAAPELCDTCEGVPVKPTVPCGDGEHESGPQCVRAPDGQCGYQWLGCPSPGVCNKLDGPARGRCFADDECERGERCEGAVVCPCDAECFAPDTPGFCK